MPAYLQKGIVKHIIFYIIYIRLSQDCCGTSFDLFYMEIQGFCVQKTIIYVILVLHISTKN